MAGVTAVLMFAIVFKFVLVGQACQVTLIQSVALILLLSYSHTHKRSLISSISHTLILLEYSRVLQ